MVGGEVLLKVLIADDEFIVRRAIRRIGQWEAFDMEICGETEDGYATLDFIIKQRPDIMILDMRMPGMSGEEILEELKKRDIRIKIIVVSGFDSFEYVRKALRYGVVDYILKPVNRTEFNEILKKTGQELSSSAPKEKTEKDICGQIKEEIDKNYSQNLAVSGFAERYFVNKDVLSRLFKKKYGVGITEYINSVRLEQAKLLLLWGYPVGRASEMVGYHDVNYFSRIFKKKYGMPPSAYVKTEQEKDSST